jgi:transmembrane sensor
MVLREALTMDRLRAMEPDEAAAYFVSCGADGLTPSEKEIMEQWLSEHAAHPAAMARANRAWDSFRDADDDEIVSAMRAHALAGPAPRWRVSTRAVAAAAVLFVIVAGSLLLGLPRFLKPADPQGTMIEYASAATQTRQILLPDGSHMTLDANSAVQGRFAANSRALHLVKGRAFFDVQHDRQRPFTVTANDRRIVDFGTKFSVGVVDGSLSVFLEQGRVSIQSLKAGVPTVMLKPGEEFVERSGKSMVGVVGNSDVVTGWRRGLITLDDAPLSDAVAQINRYSTAQIVIRDNQLREVRVSGQFRTGDAERFARTISELYPVRIVRRSGTIEMASSK